MRFDCTSLRRAGENPTELNSRTGLASHRFFFFDAVGSASHSLDGDADDEHDEATGDAALVYATADVCVG